MNYPCPVLRWLGTLHMSSTLPLVLLVMSMRFGWYTISLTCNIWKKNLYTLHRSRTPKKSNNFTAYLLWLSANLSQKQPEWCARVEMEILYEGALNGWLHVVWNMWTILCQQNIIDFIPFFFLLYSVVLYASWRRYIQEQQIIRNMKYGEVEENLEFHWFNPVQRQLLFKRWLHHMNL